MSKASKRLRRLTERPAVRYSEAEVAERLKFEQAKWADECTRNAVIIAGEVILTNWHALTKKETRLQTLVDLMSDNLQKFINGEQKEKSEVRKELERLIRA